jgi:hypothetical protein
VGLFRADSGIFDKSITAWLAGKRICHIISAKLTTALQQAILEQCRWQEVSDGIEVSELSYQPHVCDKAARFVVVHQHARRPSSVGKTLSLFANDPDLQGWRYGAMVTDLSIPAVEVWRLYRGRADCENRMRCNIRLS